MTEVVQLRRQNIGPDHPIIVQNGMELLCFHEIQLGAGQYRKGVVMGVCAVYGLGSLAKTKWRRIS